MNNLGVSQQLQGTCLDIWSVNQAFVIHIIRHTFVYYWKANQQVSWVLNYFQLLKHCVCTVSTTLTREELGSSMILGLIAEPELAGSRQSLSKLACASNIKNKNKTTKYGYFFIRYCCPTMKVVNSSYFLSL